MDAHRLNVKSSNGTGPFGGFRLFRQLPSATLLVGALLATGLLGTAELQAQPPQQGPIDSSGPANADPMENMRMQATSGSQRFSARGHSFVQNVRLANWGDEVATRVEAELKKTISIDRPIWFVVTFNEGQLPEIVRDQRIFEKNLVQRIIINRPDEVQQEDLLEALVTTLLNRVLNVDAVRSGATNLSEIPEWFSIGMAQSMFSELRNRNREDHFQLWMAHREARPERLLSLSVFPPGRLPEKAGCCMFYGWLKEQSNFRQLAVMMMGRWRRGAAVDAEWFVTVVPSIDEEEDLDRHWDLYNAYASSKRKLWDRGMQETVKKLKELMAFRAAELGVKAPPEFANELNLRELIHIPRDDWYQATVLALDLRVKMMGMGQPLALQNVVNQYGTFLDSLYDQTPNEGKGKVPGNREQLRLETMLEDANRALAQLERTLHTSEDYGQFRNEIRKIFPENGNPRTEVNLPNRRTGIVENNPDFRPRPGPAPAVLPREVRSDPIGLRPATPIPPETRITTPPRPAANVQPSPNDENIEEFLRRMEDREKRPLKPAKMPLP